MRGTVLLALVLAACGGPKASVGRSWNFDAEAPTLSAGAGEWRVVAAPDAPSPPHVLAQEARSDAKVFNVALVEATRYADLDMTVKLRAVAGEVDRGGGLVWRARDARNYYVARYNPLEGNFRLHKVVDGERIQLATDDYPASPGWHTLRVRMKGDASECELDDRVRLRARDTTFAGPGMIGFWTKADAGMHFDSLTVR